MRKKYFAAIFGLLLLVASTCAAEDAPSPAPTPGAFDQGIALYDRKKYTEAEPFFWQMIGEKPDSAQAEYYLACCLKGSGDLKAAALHFYRADQKRSTPSLRDYADNIKQGLSPEDQAWLETQLKASVPGVWKEAAPRTGQEALFLTNRAGLRIATGLDLVHIGDLDEDAQTIAYIGQQYKNNYDSTFVSEADSPFGFIYLELNPFAVLGNTEVGAVLDYDLPNRYLFKISNSQNYSDGHTFDLSAFFLGARGRFNFLVGSRVRFFLEPELGAQFLSMDFTEAYQNSSANPSTAHYGYHSDASTPSGGAQAGFQFMIGDGFSIGLSGGYHYARFTNLPAVFHDGFFPGREGVSGTAVMAYDSYWDRNAVWFMPDDQGKLNQFYGSAADAQNTRPLVIDLSAVRLNLDLALLF